MYVYQNETQEEQEWTWVFFSKYVEREKMSGGGGYDHSLWVI